MVTLATALQTCFFYDRLKRYRLCTFLCLISKMAGNYRKWRGTLLFHVTEYCRRSRIQNSLIDR